MRAHGVRRTPRIRTSRAPPRSAAKTRQLAEDLRGVADHLDVLEHVRDAAVGGDQERRPHDPHVLVAKQPLLLPDAIRVGDGVIGVGDERIGEVVLLLEAAVLLRRVRADADDLRVGSLEPREGVPETGRLERSAGCVVLRVEEKDHPRAAQGGKLKIGPSVGLSGEIRS